MKEVLEHFERMGGRLLHIMTDHASPNYLMTWGLQPTSSFWNRSASFV
jgi:hypothetical protein